MEGVALLRSARIGTDGRQQNYPRTALVYRQPAPDAERIRQAIRSHWAVENRLHWVMDVSFNDDQMRARTKAAAHNLAVLKHITLNLIRLDPVKRIGSTKTRRIIAATSDQYGAELLGLK